MHGPMKSGWNIVTFVTICCTFVTIVHSVNMVKFVTIVLCVNMVKFVIIVPSVYITNG